MRLDQRSMNLLALIVFLVVIALVGPVLYSNQAFFMTLIIYAVLATSLNIIYGYAGYLPFGFSVFFAIGAYGFGMAIKFGYDIGVALISGMGISLLLGFIFIPLLRLKGVYFAIATLGAFEAVYYVISSNLSVIARYTGGPLGIAIPSVYAPNEAYYMAAALLIVSVIVNYYILRSKFGLALRAIGDDAVSASTSGINVSFNRTLAWFLTAAFAGFAGALYGWYISFFYPETVFDVTFTLFALVFLIFGGRGTVIGPVLGTLILFSLYYFVGISYPIYFQAAFGILIVIGILFMPNGILNILRKKLSVQVI